MIVVLSGEGPTDLGQCVNGQDRCQLPEFAYGAMTVITDALLTEALGYSLLECTPDRYVYLSEQKLQAFSANYRSAHRSSMSLVGKHRGLETGYFFHNAWMLGLLTQEEAIEFSDTAIAVLFRDADCTDKTEFEKKRQSMCDGFRRSGLGERGVAMLPKPKSEAWLLCAAQEQPYQHCARLEELPGNDDSPNSAKQRLETALARQGYDSSAQQQRDWLTEKGFDADAVAAQMPSFNEFKTALARAAQVAIDLSKKDVSR